MRRAAAPALPLEALSRSATEDGTGGMATSDTDASIEQTGRGLPTQCGPQGIRFDFNAGCRLHLPARSDSPWKVTLADAETGASLLAAETAGGLVQGDVSYFVRYLVRVEADGACVFEHEFCCRDKHVLIDMSIAALGDAIAWLPCAARFQQLHGCRLTCILPGYIIPLFRGAYPAIRFIEPESANVQPCYATYRLAIYWGDDAARHQPTDYRLAGLQNAAACILGVDTRDTAPRIDMPDAGRPLEEKYACIAVQSTAQCKLWNNPSGWGDVVRFLASHGYRVVCIDKYREFGAGTAWNRIPDGVDDQTGDRPLLERARWLKHAEFFVGLSSGLSWLAWAVGTPVVLISGFSHPLSEFFTPYRVVNFHACNSCWNDTRVRFDPGDYFWCPRHANTQRQFECTRSIGAVQVERAIRAIPGFSTALA
jgi:autotransporter strand-loop-strand O-heptosyltransferase